MGFCGSALESLSSCSANMQSSSASKGTSKPGSYVRVGIGGAGNWRKIDESLPAKTNPTTPLPRHRGATGFSSGIGGAGNWHRATEVAAISPVEAVSREQIRAENVPEGFFFGVGGAGNHTSTSAKSGSVIDLEPINPSDSLKPIHSHSTQSTETSPKVVKLNLGAKLKLWCNGR